MILTSTAIAELFGAFVLGILAYRFWQTFNEKKSLISRLLFYFVAVFTFFFFYAKVKKEIKIVKRKKSSFKADKEI